MKIKLCHHVKEDGISCHSPALRGEGYCHFHLRYKGRRLRTWRNKHRLGGWRFTRRMAFDLKAIEASLKRVEKALTWKCADPERARLIRSLLQMAAADLRREEAEKRSLGDSNQCHQGETNQPNRTQINPANSIFYDNSFPIKSSHRNSRQAVDSKDTEGERVDTASDLFAAPSG